MDTRNKRMLEPDQGKKHVKDWTDEQRNHGGAWARHEIGAKNDPTCQASNWQPGWTRLSATTIMKQLNEFYALQEKKVVKGNPLILSGDAAKASTKEANSAAQEMTELFANLYSKSGIPFMIVLGLGKGKGASFVTSFPPDDVQKFGQYLVDHAQDIGQKMKESE